MAKMQSLVEDVKKPAKPGKAAAKGGLDQKKIIQLVVVVLCLGGAFVAYKMLSPPEAGPVAAPDAAQVAPPPPPDPNAAIKPKAMTEEEQTQFQMERRGTVAPSGRGGN